MDLAGSNPDFKVGDLKLRASKFQSLNLKVSRFGTLNLKVSKFGTLNLKVSKFGIKVSALPAGKTLRNRRRPPDARKVTKHNEVQPVLSYMLAA